MDDNILVFTVGEYLVGIDLSAVERVISAMEIAPLPMSSPDCMGTINIHGEIIPIINLRKVLKVEDKEIELSDQFLICHHQGKKVGLWIDQSLDIRTAPKDMRIAKGTLFLDNPAIQSIVKKDDQVILIYEVGALNGKALQV